MAENNISEMIKSSLEGIRTLADSGTVLGEPISTNNGTVIIPVSKVSVGYASGGVDYMPKSGDKDGQSKAAKPSSPCFGGGGGTGISVTPLCFLVVDKDGKVSTLNITNPSAVPPVMGTIDSISSLLEKAPDTISRIKDIFGKKEPETALDDEELEAELDELEKELDEKQAAEDEKAARKAEKEAKKAAKKAK